MKARGVEWDLQGQAFRRHQGCRRQLEEGEEAREDHCEEEDNEQALLHDHGHHHGHDDHLDHDHHHDRHHDLTLSN